MRPVALVTGSSRGIGAACAEALAKAGYAVCLNCIERADLAEALCEKLRREGADAIWVQADVADPEAVRAMVARTEKELGHVTLLVNNAGIAKQQLFQDIDRATWDRVFAVNLGGCYNTIQAVLPHMLHIDGVIAGVMPRLAAGPCQFRPAGQRDVRAASGVGRNGERQQHQQKQKRC